MKDQSGNRGTARLFLYPRRQMDVSNQRIIPAALPPRNDRLHIVQEAGWAPGTVWTGAENLASTGIRSPYHPGRSESLYRLSYKNLPKNNEAQ